MLDTKNNKPSLCGHCLCPSGSILLEINSRYYGVCKNMEHIEEIRKRIEKGKPLDRTAHLNYESVGYAIKETKKLYINFSKKHNTYELHKWETKDRKKFFETLILHYLDCEQAKASNGVPGV